MIGACALVPSLDVLVCARPSDSLIPDLGMGAWAVPSALVVLGLSPADEGFDSAVADVALARAIWH